MKTSKKIMLSLLPLVFLCGIGMQASMAANASSGGSKAGITLKKTEDPPTSSTSEPVESTQSTEAAESTQPSQSSSSAEKTLLTSIEPPSGKGIVDLPKTGEAGARGLLIAVGILLVCYSIYQMKRRRK